MHFLAILSLSVLNAIALVVVGFGASKIARLPIAGFVRGVIGAVCGILLEFARVFAAFAILKLLSTEPTGAFTLWLANFRLQGFPFLVGVGFLIAMFSEVKAAPSAKPKVSPEHVVKPRGEAEQRKVAVSEEGVRVPCEECGRLVPPATAQMTGGLCQACWEEELGGGEEASRVPCPECGRLILPVEAQQTGGLCPSCWKKGLSVGSQAPLQPRREELEGIDRGPTTRRATKILIWSSAIAAVGTILNVWLPYPWRIPPAIVAALATTTAFVSFCTVIIRMKPKKSKFSALDHAYDQTLGLGLSNLLVKFIFLGLGFFVFWAGVVLNLIFAFAGWRP